MGDMMKFLLFHLRSLVIVVISAIFVLPAVHAEGAELIDRVVAVVGGEIVALSELQEMSQRVPDVPLEKLLETLIEEKLVEIQAQRLGVEVSDNEVETAVQRQIAQMGVGTDEFEKLLEREGLTMEKYRARIRAELRKVKFVKSSIGGDVDVSEDEILNYYRRHPDEFRAQEEIHLARIFLPFPMGADAQERERVRELAGTIRAEVTKGRDFAELAKKYSKSSNAGGGGDLGWVNPKELVPAFKKAVAGLEAGKVTKVIELARGCNLLFIVDRKSADILPFEDVKEKIRQYLYSKKIAEELNKLISELKLKIPIERML